MPTYVALLRAVNVGGTGKLAMSDLKSLCEDAGFEKVKTYIASGNVVFTSRLGEAKVKSSLQTRLKAHAGKPIDVLVRTLDELTAVRDGDPFPGNPGNRTMVVFLDEAPPADAAGAAKHLAEDEAIALGRREIYVRYGHGMGRSRLVIPAAKAGTARNMNTVVKLCELAAAL